MEPLPEAGPEMLGRMLNELDFPIYTFDRERRIIFSNAAMQKIPGPTRPGEQIGLAEEGHMENNNYYDEHGNKLEFSSGSLIDSAFQGIETRDLLIEHRNLKERTHAWLSITCVPVMNADNEFVYGIIWYRDISKRKSREDKLRFLLSATRILSITTEFRARLKEKAALTVPTLADWCSIEIVNPEGKLERAALVHRDPKKVEWILEYERKYPTPPGGETSSERVVRTRTPEFIPRVTQDMIDAVPDLTDEQREDISSLSLSSIMTFPIGTSGNVLGTLTLAYAESGRVYTEEDFAFFEEFSRHLSVLLENARLYNEINQRDLAKDLFLASLSHELRNPLAPIKTSLELLRLKNPDSGVAQEINVVEHQFTHMAKLLDDLLDTTRFESGKIRLNAVPVDLRTIVADVVQATLPVALEAGIDFQAVTSEEPIMVRVDRTRIEQAITNVLSNAMKFTDAGGTVRISLTKGDENACIVIQDTGAGITMDELKHVFEPYYQSERTKTGNAGLGLGLRLVQEILRLHDGSISAESRGSDQGSIFTMCVPVIEAPEEETPVAVASDAGNASEKQILVLDDNKAAADALVRLFTALGWSAIARYSAKDAFVHMDESPADIIFADIGMPDMNGYEFVRTLRENGYPDLPVVALTGYGLEEDRERALAAGFNEHLTKPVGVEDLKRVITTLT